jgi:hypothetical protein
MHLPLRQKARVTKFTAKWFLDGAPALDCGMTETMIAPAPRMAVPAGPSPCEISTLPEAARALRMMDRELTLLRQEYQREVDRREQGFARARRAAVFGIVLGSCGLGLALVALLVR